MSYFPDLGQRSQIAEGHHVRAVGWLQLDHPYSKGPVSDEFLSRLKEFARLSDQSAEALYFAIAGGPHTCEFCGKVYTRGNFGVPSGDLLFVAPEMVVHYVEQHEYCPPAEFIEAVLHSPLPDTEEYQVLTEPFWHLHKSYVAQAMRAMRNT